MEELGGYFPLELRKGEHYHREALALNSARNCLKYIVKAQRPSKIYLPAYCCDSLLEPLEYEEVEYDFYHINAQLELIKFPNLKSGERLLYINYFGIKFDYVKYLHRHYGSALIVDNTQAFFEKPIYGVDTFYSPRKFFGVTDGGYLYTSVYLDEVLEQDQSRDRFAHLLGRHENNANIFYPEYQKNEGFLVNQPIKIMSELTQRILASLCYEQIALTRQRNFWMLHAALVHSNEFKEFPIGEFVPMVYPYCNNDSNLRRRLLENKIYVAKYWSDAAGRANPHESYMIDKAIYLPIDQRVDIIELNKIVGVVYG